MYSEVLVIVVNDFDGRDGMLVGVTILVICVFSAVVVDIVEVSATMFDVNSPLVVSFTSTCE